MRLNVQEKLNLSSKFRDLKLQQQSVPELREIASKAPDIGSLEVNYGKYGMKEGVLYKKVGRVETSWKVYIPDHMADDIIRAYHEHLGHSGSDRVALAMEQSFYIKRLSNKCRKLIGSCMLCLRSKPLNVRYYTEPTYILRDRPRALVCCDIHGPMPRSAFGNQYIFVLYDVFTKFTKIYPMKAINTRGCLKKVLEEYIPRYGQIQALMADNASLFSSPVWRRTLEEKGIKCYHPSLYHPQANSCERSLRNICLYLRAYCHSKHTKWHAYCPLVEAIINRTPNPSTQVSPEKLMTGKEPESLFSGIPATVPIPGQVEQNEMQRVYEKLKKRAEDRLKTMKKSKKLWDIKIGERVLVRKHNLSKALKKRTSKLELLYSEPRIVTQKFGSDTFELTTEKGKIVGRYHKSQLRKLE